MTEIFVFGSNLRGVHGAGAAEYARNHYGAKLGIGVGPQGNAYAIPTKDYNIYDTLPLETIKTHVDNFLDFASNHHTHTFKVVAIGCGLAGYTPEDIGPMFEQAPTNCRMPPEWKNVKELQHREFWSYAEQA